MVATISRNELKGRIERGDNYHLVETLPEAAYHHAHLPGAINLPPDKATLCLFMNQTPIACATLRVLLFFGWIIQREFDIVKCANTFIVEHRDAVAV